MTIMTEISLKSEIGEVVRVLLVTEAKTATKYISEKLTIRASRKLLKGKIPPSNSNIDVVLTIGRPNFEAREFIKQCKKDGEKFPVKKIQLEFPTKK
jgi:hypothetical protein